MTTRAPFHRARHHPAGDLRLDLHHPFALGPAPQHQEAGAGLRPDHLGPHLVATDTGRAGDRLRLIGQCRMIRWRPVAKNSPEPSQSSRTAAMIDADMIFLTHGYREKIRMRSHSGGVAV